MDARSTLKILGDALEGHGVKLAALASETPKNAPKTRRAEPLRVAAQMYDDAFWAIERGAHNEALWSIQRGMDALLPLDGAV